MKKFFLGPLLIFYVSLIAMQNDTGQNNTHNNSNVDELLAGFDWNSIELFTQATFQEIKERGSFKLAVIETNDKMLQSIKTFYSAQEFAKHILTTSDPSSNPENRQYIIGLTRIDYLKNEGTFCNPKYYDPSEPFLFMYETLSFNDLTNRMFLHYARACSEIADWHNKESIKAQFRQAAYTALQQVSESKEINALEEQDLCAFLAELHAQDVPSSFKDFSAVEKYSKRILDLKSAVSDYLKSNKAADTTHVFDVDEPTTFAHIMLGKIYSVGGDGVAQDRPKAYAQIQEVIKNPYSSNYLHNEAILAQACLLCGDISGLPVPVWMRLKKIRERSIRRDLRTISQNNPSAQQESEARRILDEMFSSNH